MFPNFTHTVEPNGDGTYTINYTATIESGILLKITDPDGTEHELTGDVKEYSGSCIVGGEGEFVLKGYSTADAANYVSYSVTIEQSKIEYHQNTISSDTKTYDDYDIVG